MDNNEFLEQVYRSSYDGLFIYANSKLHNTDLAEEAVQETFRIACAKPEALQSSPNPKGWLVKTLKYVLMDTKRHRQKDMELIAAIADIPLDTLITYDDTKVEVLYQRQMGDPAFRMLVRFAVYGESVATISKKTGLSISAVKKRMERARKKYQKEM